MMTPRACVDCRWFRDVYVSRMGPSYCRGPVCTAPTPIPDYVYGGVQHFNAIPSMMREHMRPCGPEAFLFQAKPLPWWKKLLNAIGG